MIPRQKLNQARRMIENQHLALAGAKTFPRASEQRNKLLLLAVYSNLIANELVAQQIEGV